MPRVVHFEINSEQPEKAAAFYSEVFGWTIQKRWSGNADYWLVHTGMSSEPGINGGIKKKVTPSPAIVTTVEVNDLDAHSEKVVAAGGKLISEKIAIPQTGYLLYCEDPEGTPFSIIEKDTSVS